MNSITVFCGSNSGADRIYEEQAYNLGHYLATQNMRLIYGGARIGLMGAVANGVLDNGGKAIGVLPHFLQGKEIGHDSLTEMIMVETMHERKLKMNKLSDGVIALPGGYGTLEEFFEMITWAQLGLHTKPVGLLNINGFYDPMINMLKQMVEKGFLKQKNRDLILISNDYEDLIRQMKHYQSPHVEKWITPEQT